MEHHPTNRAWAQSIADEALKVARELGLEVKFNLLHIPVDIRQGRCAKAWVGKGYITIPPGVFEKHPGYVIHIVVHEVAHFIKGAVNHGGVFKSIEQRLLKHWGIELEYHRAYAKRIFQNDTCIYDQSANPPVTHGRRANITYTLPQGYKVQRTPKGVAKAAGRDRKASKWILINPWGTVIGYFRTQAAAAYRGFEEGRGR